MTIKNGDLPASPTVYADLAANGQRELYCDQAGLSKREQFAAMAMQGFCSNMEWTYGACPGGIVPANWIARQSLAAADALLAELERTK